MATKEDARDEIISDDFLYGAKSIGRFVKRPPRWVYHNQKDLGLIHIGATLVGTKTKITKILSGEV
jgi:hypothetical protein